MIDTERLILKPLTYSQLIKYMRTDHSLEQELHLNETSRSISPALREALEQSILLNVANPNKNHLFFTLWTVIWKEKNKMVGDLCFMGEPNAKGEVEIGYGTYEAFRNKGFMTEAVSGLIRWAQGQPRIVAIIASAEKDNIASAAVLEKNKFMKVGETETLFNWRLKIK
ncbi:MAG: GNAT family N-acetyltransferase [Lewinellaceae bacterium]|nr:GNAT family N-acetyltransferase [Phaeodactylibacter sp.]MCB0614599.1 GNAT family N-acetyltransferase [Phaeodactylibacter sp.]MCB9351647.1 GNAT family N-acetyltransferase [Lewinellaceae bacterium]